MPSSPSTPPTFGASTATTTILDAQINRHEHHRQHRHHHRDNDIDVEGSEYDAFDAGPASFYPTPRLSPLQQVLPYSSCIPVQVTSGGSVSTDTTAPSASTVAWEPPRPDYSPITPKVQPILPAIVPSLAGQPPLPQHERAQEQQNSAIQPVAIAPVAAPAQKEQPPKPTPSYIPRPQPKPFSSEDSTDAIALRAAISALQFQKKKAQDDVRALEATRRKALQDPLLFKDELAAGRIREQRHTPGDMNSVLDASDSEDEDEDDMDLSVAENTSKETLPRKPSAPSQPPFARIPGPQNVVRMPPINWDKYNIVGAPLDELHEQQRRWPGSAPYTHDRGREHSVAAPYSPFHDPLYDANGTERKDSGATVSEHPMETRRGRRAS
nr:hypothetical protein CFP56_09903 [Quercus suber]